MFKKIILLFLSWRVFLILLLFQNLLKVRQGFEYTSPLHFIKEPNIISNFLISPWANFDGIYYLIISSAGYTVDNAGFFPLFPLLINVLSSLFGNIGAFEAVRYFIALILVTVLFLLALYYFYKLIKIDFKNNIALESIFYLLIFPTSFFFAAIYSESLFLFLVVLSFYFSRKRKWLLASIFAAFLMTTRLTGIAIIPALLYEFIKTEKRLFIKKAFPLLIMPVGIICFMVYDFIFLGNAFQFISAQGALQNERAVDKIIFLPQTIFRYIKILVGGISFTQYEWWIALLELFSFILVLVFLYIAWKKKVRLSYVIFSIFAVLIPASSGTLTGIPRYILAAFPIFIVPALIKNRWIKLAYSLVCIVLLAILFILFSKRYYVG